MSSRLLPSSRRTFAAVVSATALAVLTACSSGSASVSTSDPAAATSGAAAASPSPSAAAAAGPITVTGANGPVTLPAVPKRIVSMSATATEMIFAVGAGSEVVAVDDQSNFPATAPKTTLSGFKPSAEAVAGYTPDLVVASNDSSGFVASMTKLKIPVLLLPAAVTLDEAYAQMTTIGTATGHSADATALVATTKDRIAKAIASVPAKAKGEKVYHELDPTFYSATSGTFIGAVYQQMGLVDIADQAKDAVTSGGYPKLSAEFIVTAKPDVIVLTDGACCQQDEAAVAKRPAFATIPAVKDHKVIVMDADIASRWGPRVADFAEAVAKVLQN
jgi:ABC-type Fe3+-hydroxamate transport system substrate-binding protein